MVDLNFYSLEDIADIHRAVLSVVDVLADHGAIQDTRNVYTYCFGEAGFSSLHCTSTKVRELSTMHHHRASCPATLSPLVAINKISIILQGICLHRIKGLECVKC